MVTELNKENFGKEVKESETPVIVDFWASWCGPCKMMAPVFEEVSKDYEGKLKFAKVNTEENQELASENGIMSIPCLIVFNQGKEVDRIVGFKQKEDLKGSIDSVLGKI